MFCFIFEFAYACMIFSACEVIYCMSVVTFQSQWDIVVAKQSSITPSTNWLWHKQTSKNSVWGVDAHCVFEWRLLCMCNALQLNLLTLMPHQIGFKQFPCITDSGPLYFDPPVNEFSDSTKKVDLMRAAVEFVCIFLTSGQNQVWFYLKHIIFMHVWAIAAF